MKIILVLASIFLVSCSNLSHNSEVNSKNRSIAQETVSTHTGFKCIMKYTNDEGKVVEYPGYYLTSSLPNATNEFLKSLYSSGYIVPNKESSEPVAMAFPLGGTGREDATSKPSNVESIGCKELGPLKLRLPSGVSY